MAGQFCMCIFKGHSLIAFKYLNYCSVLIEFNDTAQLLLAALYRYFYDFIKGSALNAFQNDKGAVNLTKS